MTGIYFEAKRRGNGKKKELEGIVAEQLALNERLEVIYFTMDVGATFGEPYTHRGQEVHYLLKGEVEAIVGGKKYKFREGDVVVINSNKPHTFKNNGKKKVEAITVTSPPTSF
jgi:mannose-6-phosphate isomerase-like protein (cupin superfamily)